MHYKFIKKYYFIEKFEKSNIDKQDLNTTIIYRNYKKNYKVDEILLLRNYCRSKKLRFILSNNIKLSLNLDLDGVYLPSFNNNFSHLSYKLKRKFLILGSAHNLKELRIKEKQKVDEVFISSIFKKNKNFLGINKFNLISKLSNKKIVALGGISKENFKLINLTQSTSFAGISFFR